MPNIRSKIPIQQLSIPKQSQRQQALPDVVKKAKAGVQRVPELAETAGGAFLYGRPTPAAAVAGGGLFQAGGQRPEDMAAYLAQTLGAGAGTLTRESAGALKDYMLQSLKTTGYIYPPQELRVPMMELMGQQYQMEAAKEIYEQLGAQEYEKKAIVAQVIQALTPYAERIPELEKIIAELQAI